MNGNQSYNLIIILIIITSSSSAAEHVLLTEENLIKVSRKCVCLFILFNVSLNNYGHMETGASSFPGIAMPGIELTTPPPLHTCESKALSTEIKQELKNIM